MPIIIAPINKKLKVIRISANEKTKKRLESLGITVGSVLFVISNNAGDIIVNTKDSKIAIEKNVAIKIYVENVRWKH